MERQGNADQPAADQEKFVALVLAMEDVLTRLVGALVHALLEGDQRFRLSSFEELDFGEFEQLLLAALQARFGEDAILDPLQRVVQLAVDAHMPLRTRQPDDVEITFEVFTRRDGTRKVREDQIATVFRYYVFNALEHVRGSHVDELHAAHVEQDVAARLQLRLQRRQQLVGRTKEQEI